jgi:cadmium resistance protein CadD (predicted permease)
MTEVVLDSLMALLLAAAGYVSTNVDNLLLMGTIAAGHPDQRAVTRGYIAASTAVLAASVAFIFLTLVLTPDTLGYLGLLPIALGLRMLLGSGDELGRGPGKAPTAMSIAAVLFANSSDSIAVFGSLIAESEKHVVIALVVGFVLASIAWLALIRQVSSRYLQSSRVQSLATRAMPCVMIAIGIYILLDSTTDTLQV